MEELLRITEICQSYEKEIDGIVEKGGKVRGKEADSSTLEKDIFNSKWKDQNQGKRTGQDLWETEVTEVTQ